MTVEPPLIAALNSVWKLAGTGERGIIDDDFRAGCDSENSVNVQQHFVLVCPRCPIGAILYRMSSFLHRRWAERSDAELAAFGSFAGQVFRLLDWVPARLTGIAFAVVGDFEDAAYCWRTQAAKWPDPSLGVVLASGAGAMGVRLGMPFLSELSPLDRPELGLGDEADVGFLDSTVGLVWRALVVILFILLLLGIARALN